MNWFGWKKLFPILFLKVDHLSFSYHSPFALKVIEHKPYDHKADVFSFGVVLWELLSGKVMLGCSNSLFFQNWRSRLFLEFAPSIQLSHVLPAPV